MRRVLLALPLLLLLACTSNRSSEDRPPVVMELNEPGDAKVDDKDKDDELALETPDAGASASDVEPKDGISTCATARSIGTIIGDATGNPLKDSGRDSEWVSIIVAETPSGVLGHEVAVRFQLTSPASCEFDLYAYYDADRNEPSCTAEVARSTKVGTAPETVTLRWGESWWTPNFGDDSRTLALEIRRMSGECAAGDTWKLEAVGNPEE